MTSVFDDCVYGLDYATPLQPQFSIHGCSMNYLLCAIAFLGLATPR